LFSPLGVPFLGLGFAERRYYGRNIKLHTSLLDLTDLVTLEVNGEKNSLIQQKGME